MPMAKLNLHKDIDKPLWKEHYRGETAPFFILSLQNQRKLHKSLILFIFQAKRQ